MNDRWMDVDDRWMDGARMDGWMCPWVMDDGWMMDARLMHR